MKNLEKLALIQKMIQKNPLFEERFEQFDMTDYGISFYVRMDRAIVRQFAQNKKWKLELDLDSGLIRCHRVLCGLNVRVIIW